MPDPQPPTWHAPHDDDERRRPARPNVDAVFPRIREQAATHPHPAYASGYRCGQAIGVTVVGTIVIAALVGIGAALAGLARALI